MTTTQPPACGKISEELLDAAFRELQHDTGPQDVEYQHQRASLGKAFAKILSHRHPAPVADERAAENSFDKQTPLGLKLWLDSLYNETGDLRYIHAGNFLMAYDDANDRAIAALSAQPSGALEREPSADAELSEHARRIDAKGLRDPADGLHKRGNPSRHGAKGRERTTLRMETSAIHALKNLASANAREGITSVLMPADIYSLCLEVIALRRALESIRCRSSELAKKTSVEIRNDLHGIYADAAEALADSFAAPPPERAPGGDALLGPVGHGVFLYNGRLLEVVHTDGDRAYQATLGGRYVVPLYIKPTECESLNAAYPSAPPPSSSPSATADATSSVAIATLRAALEGLRGITEAQIRDGGAWYDIQFAIGQLAALAGNEGEK